MVAEEEEGSLCSKGHQVYDRWDALVDPETQPALQTKRVRVVEKKRRYRRVS